MKEKLAEEELLLRDGLQPSSAALVQLDREIDSRQDDNSAYELQDSDDDYRVSEDDGWCKQYCSLQHCMYTVVYSSYAIVKCVKMNSRDHTHAHASRAP